MIKAAHILAQILRFASIPGFPNVIIEEPDAFDVVYRGLADGRIRIIEESEIPELMGPNSETWQLVHHCNVEVAHDESVKLLAYEVRKIFRRYHHFYPPGWDEATDGEYHRVTVKQGEYIQNWQIYALPETSATTVLMAVDVEVIEQEDPIP